MSDALMTIVGPLVIISLMRSHAKGRDENETVMPPFWTGGYRISWKFIPHVDIMTIGLLIAIIAIVAFSEPALIVGPLLGLLIIFWVAHVVPKPTVIIHAESARRDAERARRDGETRGLARMYRVLAQKFHPDRARTLPQKVYHERMMKMINKAYSERDALTLFRLLSVKDYELAEGER